MDDNTEANSRSGPAVSPEGRGEWVFRTCRGNMEDEKANTEDGLVTTLLAAALVFKSRVQLAELGGGEIVVGDPVQA